MKRRIFSALLLTFLTICASSQVFLTRNAKVTFFSKAPVEKIEAVNNEVTSVLNTAKGEFGFVVLIKSFKFKKALMEEHFNENYMESNTYPKANFKGNITDLSTVNFGKDGTYSVNVKGDMILHGVTKSMEVPGTITISKGNISVTSKFNLKLKDYNIKIPSTVINNISEIVDITLDSKYEPYKKS